MATGAAVGAGALGAYASYKGAEKQADARKEGAETANAPYRQKKPYLQDLYGQASDYANEFGQPTEAEQQGLAEQQQIAENLMGAGFGEDTQAQAEIIRNLAGDTAQGKYLGPESNPYLQDTIDMAQRQTQQQFEEQALPQIRSQAIESGAYGGAREGLVEAQAAEDAQQQQADIATQMLMKNYAKERNRQMQAAELARQAQTLEQAGAQMQLAPAQMLQEVGNQRAQLNRRGLDALGQYLGVGPNRQAAAEAGQIPLLQAIQGGLGGASAGMSLYNMATEEQE